MNWLSLLGDFETPSDGVVFKGGTVEGMAGDPQVALGNLLSDQVLGDGEVSADVTFNDSAEEQGCELILFYQPQSGIFITAGFPAWHSLLQVRSFSNRNPQAFAVYGTAGERSQLVADRPYRLSVAVRGSRVSVGVNDITMLLADLPIALPRGQTGIWCRGTKDIKITGFSVKRKNPRVFVLMEFSEQFNEFHQEVVTPICSALGLEAYRADDTYGPGLIIADIVRQITESKIVIAEVSSANANVYYELGYAHAMNKPTIIIAEKNTRLPFDVAPFRTLFYENSISGKTRVEEGLRKHLEAIQADWSG